ncbi:hypothetical protein DEM27_13000 [Metarhizobium album]|uniref:BON domain-containing protein n=1 Tax=Metarhizobium album TaxID=2182425 RepID=A0A2U2DQL8_9HYPH|nr:BON domain-containing protein [Rhizobium album]PWE55603.1 hypothetical protein DEM27_13000 [Rhizobium album]
MLFKDRTFHGNPPQDEQLHARSALEAAVASKLAAAGTLDASDLNVVVRGSEVAISGSLSCREEIDRAIEVVMSIPGVTAVNHTIFVRSL